MIKKLFILLLLSSNFIIACYAQSIKVSARIDSSKIQIGDYVKMDIKASYTHTSTVVWPDLKEDLSDHIAIINKSVIDTVSGTDTISLSRTYTLTSYDSGSFFIPALKFKYNNKGDTAFREAFTDSILLDVKSIAVDTTKTYKDIKGPISVPSDWSELIPYVIGCILLAALIWFVIYYIHKRRKGEKLIDFSKPALPPHEIALLSLEKLKNKKLWQNNKIKEYYTELTEIIRVYIEKRFLVAAMEMTSDEIITAFRSIDITDDLISKLRQLFLLSDLVKFAKANPLPNEHDLSFYNAQTFVKDSIPAEVPANTDNTINAGAEVQSADLFKKEEEHYV
ncbi:MAG: hypothetical protein V1904_11925 [Bacteroidota bacterium]